LVLTAVEAWARCAVPKASCRDVAVTKFSAICAASLHGCFFLLETARRPCRPSSGPFPVPRVETGVFEQWDVALYMAATSMSALAQSEAKATGLPSILARYSATV
jgi:hypothetical protein